MKILIKLTNHSQAVREGAQRTTLVMQKGHSRYSAQRHIPKQALPKFIHHAFATASPSDPTLHFNRDSAYGNSYKKSALRSNKESKLLWTPLFTCVFPNTHFQVRGRLQATRERQHAMRGHKPGNTRGVWEFDTSKFLTYSRMLT